LSHKSSKAKSARFQRGQASEGMRSLTSHACSRTYKEAHQVDAFILKILISMYLHSFNIKTVVFYPIDTAML